MRRFDDRFARQNRCEPPPEFPLASPYPRIVHHLSGPNSYALTQIHPKTSGSVDDAPRKGLSPPFTFITREGLTPKHSHKCSTPWSVFQDGSLTTIMPASLPEGAVLGPRKGIMRGAITLPRELRSSGFYPPTKTDAGLNLAKCTGENTG
ncbi:hypothetical protein F4823DRAFT_629965 [Ustulina deusta]|nr:hypothetical protein F4823DRAFT_629965 [Ustulina deusta]